jgi:hypothetical protein
VRSFLEAEPEEMPPTDLLLYVWRLRWLAARVLDRRLNWADRRPSIVSSLRILRVGLAVEQSWRCTPPSATQQKRHTDLLVLLGEAIWRLPDR